VHSEWPAGGGAWLQEAGRDVRGRCKVVGGARRGAVRISATNQHAVGGVAGELLGVEWGPGCFACLLELWFRRRAFEVA
jgi:hypothetical protein